MAIEEEHVMHSVLAVSASHWRYHRKSPQQRCLSEIFHSMQACVGLRQCLDVPRADQTDAAMITSMFLGSVSFADTTEVFQVPLKSRPVPFFWLGNQLGVGALVSLFQTRANRHSLLLGVFEELAQVVVHVDDDRSGTNDIPAELATIFEVEDSSTCNEHPYLGALRRLCRLLRTDPENEFALLQYMQFVDGLSPQFIRLLNALDTRALMLLSYWLALLCAKDCWWSRVRARTDCWTICEHLELHGDETSWKYMDFPAKACGYPYTGAVPSGQYLVDLLRLESRQLG
ncbi:hypothetical protein H2200_001455 [Cladophialophora chaetospira]|uniref:C6 transcription factor n=1 Tax=Cladophialophora chaetospira TaxID=386627 RepID=A0AA38XLP4_9EURO|nr:hypothetical protein H2200_001455 [Cladophialophora chaetospira]